MIWNHQHNHQNSRLYTINPPAVTIDIVDSWLLCIARSLSINHHQFTPSPHQKQAADLASNMGGYYLLDLPFMWTIPIHKRFIVVNCWLVGDQGYHQNNCFWKMLIAGYDQSWCHQPALATRNAPPFSKLLPGDNLAIHVTGTGAEALPCGRPA